MSYRVQIHGIEISCDSASEAIALAKHAGGASKPLTKANSSSDRRRIEHAQRSLRFLAAVRDAGNRGVGGPELVKAVKCNGPAGLGTVVQQTRGLLHAAGFSLEAIAKKERKGDEKSWVAGPQIEEGVRALQEMVSAG